MKSKQVDELLDAVAKYILRITNGEKTTSEAEVQVLPEVINAYCVLLNS